MARRARNSRGSKITCVVPFLHGVFAGADSESPRFYSLRPPDAKDVAAVASRVAVRVAVLLETHDSAVEQGEPAMAELCGASTTGTLAMSPNAGQKVKTALFQTTY